jgi:hypothetical protein
LPFSPLLEKDELQDPNQRERNRIPTQPLGMKYQTPGVPDDVVLEDVVLEDRPGNRSLANKPPEE